MFDVNMRRSQAILRMPVDQVFATLILHDGERFEVLLFVPPGEGVARLITAEEPFLPVTRDSKISLIARAAIACAGIVTRRIPVTEGDLPVESQVANVRLRSGVVLTGELRWTVVEGRARTADHLNNPGLYIELFTSEMTYYILKSHIALVEEA